MKEASAANEPRSEAGTEPTPTQIAGKYRVLRLLGRGASGSVYLCEHTALEKQVAVKVLHRELAELPDLLARFRREAQTAARLDHPNSVHVMDFGQDDDGTLYLAMEYVEGRDLAQMLDEGVPFDTGLVVHIMTSVLSALSAAHALGIVHRDLKPENIMLRRAQSGSCGADTVKVCDFGVAQLSPIRLEQTHCADSAASGRVTGEGMVVGTPWYMSPEQARAETLDARSDIYSAGVVLFQLLTRTLPFVGDDAMAVAVMHCTTPPPPPSGFGPVHPALEAVCLRALSKTREARYQSAAEMLSAVREAVAVQVPSRSLARSSSKPGRAVALALVRSPVSPVVTDTELATPAVRVPPRSRKLRTSLLMATVALSMLALAAVPQLLPRQHAGLTSVSAASAETPQREAPSLVAAPPAPPALTAAVPIEDDPELSSAVASASLPHGSALPEQASSSARPLSAAAAPATRAQAPRKAPLMAAKAATDAKPEPPRRDPKPPAEPAQTPAARAHEPQSAESAPPQPPQAAEPEPAPAAARLEAPAEPPTSPPDTSSAEPAAPSDPQLVPSAQLGAGVRPASRPALPVVPVVPTKPRPEPRPITKVHVETDKLPAGTSRASLRAALNVSALTSCYIEAQRRAPGTPLPGTTLELHTNMSGRIVTAQVGNAALPHTLRDCLEQAARAGRVRNGDGGEVTATVNVQPEP